MAKFPKLIILFITGLLFTSLLSITHQTDAAGADFDFTQTIDRVERFIAYNQEANEALIATLVKLNMSQQYVIKSNHDTTSIRLKHLLTAYTNLVELQSYFRANNFSKHVKEQIEAKVNATKKFFQNLPRIHVLMDGFKAKLAQRNQSHCIADKMFNLACMRQDYETFHFVDSFIKRWIHTVNSGVNTTMMEQIKEHLDGVHQQLNKISSQRTSSRSSTTTSYLNMQNIPLLYQGSLPKSQSLFLIPSPSSQMTTTISQSTTQISNSVQSQMTFNKPVIINFHRKG